MVCNEASPGLAQGLMETLHYCSNVHSLAFLLGTPVQLLNNTYQPITWKQLDEFW